MDVSTASPPAHPANAATGQSRYGSLATALRGRIQQGEWLPGEAIAPEAELARGYGVALGTMRQAISVLVADGLLERRQGKGTFVRAGLGGASMLRFFRFRQGEGPQAAPRSRIVARMERAAETGEAQQLGLPAGAPVLALARERSVDGRPCLLETLLLPLPLFEPLAASDPEAWGDLLYPLYQRACGVAIHRAEDQIRFERFTDAQAARLGLPPGHPCVRVQRRAFDLAGRCVELRATWGDAFAFEYTAQVR